MVGPCRKGQSGCGMDRSGNGVERVPPRSATPNAGRVALGLGLAAAALVLLFATADAPQPITNGPVRVRSDWIDSVRPTADAPHTTAASAPAPASSTAVEGVAVATGSPAEIPSATPAAPAPAAPAARSTVAPSPDPAAPVRDHVLVVVRDRAGIPIEGAWVAVAGHRPEPHDGIGDVGLRPTWEDEARTATDAAGRAVLPVPAVEELVVHARFGASEGRSAPFARDRWVIEVVVAPADPPPPGLGALILRVRADGRAAVKVPLRVELTRRPIVLDGSYAGDDAGRATVKGTTDAGGELPIGRLPTGGYDLVVSAAGRADARLAVVVEAAAVRLDVDLDHPGRAASGPLLPPAGVAAGAVRVTVVTSLGDYPAVVVPVEGGGWRWRAPGLPPGEHLVVGEVADHGSRCERLFVAGGTVIESGPTLSWAGAGAIRGRLVAQDRTPVRDARLRLAPQWPQPAGIGRPRPPFVNRREVEGRPRATAEAREAQDLRRVGLALEATTDQDGRFLLRGAAAGPYLLVGPHRLELPLGVSGDLDLRELVVVVDPAPPRRRVAFTGRVSVEAPARLARATLDVRQRGVAGRRLDVDGSGHFAFEAELAERDVVHVRGAGVDQDGRTLFQAGPPLALDAESTGALEVRLLPAARLSGRLLLPPALAGRAGQVVVREAAPARADGAVLVEESTALGWQAAATPDADKRWSVGDVPAGRPLQVWSGASLLRSLTLQPDEAHELVEDLSGRTLVQPVRVDDLPDPLASCAATVVWDAGHARAPLLRGQGVVPGLPPGVAATLRLEVEEPRTGSFWTAELPLAEPGREPAVVQLPRWRGGLRGTLPKGASGPVRAAGRAGAVVAAEVAADAEGKFLLELPAGFWRVTAGGCAPVDVQVRDAVETDVALQPAQRR